MSYAVARRSWFEDVRQAAPRVDEVASELGLYARSGRFGPCPACGADDPRHPACTLRHGGAGWMCAHCKETGDALRLVAWVVTGRPKPDGPGWAAVRDVCARQGWCAPAEYAGTWVPPIRPARAPEPERPFPEEPELARLLAACRPVGTDPVVAEYCVRRGFGPRLAAAALPDVYPWPTWWGFGRARVWRLCVTACDAGGKVRSLHARAVVDTAEGKTRWPAGRRCRGLLFADPLVGRRLLRRQALRVPVRRFVVVEGITDYLAVSSRCGDDTAVFGATSGGFSALATASIPADLPGLIWTDPDATGDRYAAEIIAALPHHDLRRMPRR